MWDSPAEARRWWLQAENDLAFARLALRERFFAQACFVAQQTAEKAVKAIAYGLGERAVLGHSIVVLIDRYGDRVAGLRELRRDAGLLDQFYVPARYPNGLPAACRSRPSTSRRPPAPSTPPTASCSSRLARCAWADRLRPIGGSRRPAARRP